MYTVHFDMENKKPLRGIREKKNRKKFTTFKRLEKELSKKKPVIPKKGRYHYVQLQLFQ